MNFYEIIVSLTSHGKEIGRTVCQTSAASPFQAAVQVTESMEGKYGDHVVARTRKVSPITEDEFLYQLAA